MAKFPTIETNIVRAYLIKKPSDNPALICTDGKNMRLHPDYAPGGHGYYWEMDGSRETIELKDPQGIPRGKYQAGIYTPNQIEIGQEVVFGESGEGFPTFSPKIDNTIGRVVALVELSKQEYLAALENNDLEELVSSRGNE